MASRTKHGAYLNGKEVPEHYVWRTLVRRDKGRSGKYYTNVQVCDRWRDYSNFIADMGPRPSPKHEIDRINPWGDYEPSNCRWVTRSVNQKNKRSTKFYTENGATGTLYEWAATLGISPQLAIWRWKQWGTFVKGRTWVGNP
jgi:hypothetical protein